VKLSDFFIDRPIFAAVLSAFITIGGAIALFKLPISEYPRSFRLPSWFAPLTPARIRRL